MVELETTVVSKNLIADAIFAVTHLYLLENEPSPVFIHLEPRFCPFSRFRFVAAIYNESEIPLPRMKLNFTFDKPETQKSYDQSDKEPASVSTTLTLSRDIAAGDCVAESFSPRFYELPLIVSVSVRLYHTHIDPAETSQLLNDVLLTVCFTSFDALFDQNQVDEVLEKDDSYNVCDDGIIIPLASATVKISAQNAVDITEAAFNEITETHIVKSLFSRITSTPSFTGFVLVQQTFHRISVEVNKVVPWTDEAAFTMSLTATSGTSYQILQGLRDQLETKIKFLVEKPVPRCVHSVISNTLQLTMDDCDLIRVPRFFDEPYAEE